MQNIPSNTATQPAETEQVPNTTLVKEGRSTMSAILINNNVGPCPECRSQVIQYDDRFECPQVVDGRCNFTIATTDIEAAFIANVADVILDLFVGDNDGAREIMSGLLPSLSKTTVTWHDSDHSIYEYYDLQLAKSNAGLWSVQITRDDEELAALAKEGYARMCAL